VHRGIYVYNLIFGKLFIIHELAYAFGSSLKITFFVVAIKKCGNIAFTLVLECGSSYGKAFRFSEHVFIVESRGLD